MTAVGTGTFPRRPGEMTRASFSAASTSGTSNGHSGLGPQRRGWLHPHRARTAVNLNPGWGSVRVELILRNVSTFQIFAQHLADDPAPGAVLLLIAVVVNALELLVLVFHERIERTGARVTRFINACGCGLHVLHNRQAL